MPRPRKPRAVDATEAELFAAAVAQAKPLRNRPAVAEIFTRPRKSPITLRPITHPPVEDRPAPQLNVKGRTATTALDGRNAERLIKGKLEIEGRIDLHGQRQDAAQRVLGDFIRRNHAYGKRCVLVITGKGRSLRNQPEEDAANAGRFTISERKGVLFDLVPVWLSAPDLAPYVVAFHPAQAKHGGSGALYVYLRRERRS